MFGILLTNCVLPRMALISIPKWSWKTTLAFWRFLSLSLFVLFWECITETRRINIRHGQGSVPKATHVTVTNKYVMSTINYILKYKHTLFSPCLFFFKFLYLLDDAVLLHLLLLNLGYHVRDSMLFPFQWHIILYQVWGNNIELAQRKTFTSTMKAVKLHYNVLFQTRMGH